MKLIILFLLLTSLISIAPTPSFAYGECSDYGPMAMLDSLTDKCKCISGYVFSTGVTGTPYCTSADIVCHDKYGYSSRYDSLSESCKCSYGYIFGKDSIGRTKCVSPDSVCTDKLGYNAQYDSISDTCECRSGYVISGGSCTSGDSVCRTKHGLYSSYNDYENVCECDDGYTLDDTNQCVKKQNNVYFTLKELDTSNKEAIIRSEYDYRYYLITYSSGCYDSSFRRYLGHQIVVNLGTDYDLDTWDKIVLQDDNETCDIRSMERADSSTTLLEEEEDSYYSPTINYNYKPVSNPPVTKPQPIIIATKEPQKEVAVKKQQITASSSNSQSATATTTIKQATTTLTSPVKQRSFGEKIKSFFKRFI